MNGIGRDVFVLAIVLSVAAHLGIMFWARPRVMTHALPASVLAAHREPMQVRAAAERPDPVRIDVFEDEAAVKEAPGVSEQGFAAPAVEAVKEVHEETLKAPASEAPEIISRIRPADTAKIAPAAVESRAVSESAPRMTIDACGPAVAAAAPRPAAAEPAAMSVPALEVPSFVPTPVSAAAAEDGTAEKIGREAEPENKPKSFTPVAEVMAEVDEKIVESEKRAVRELLDSARSLDIAGAVNVGLSSESRDGWTYFRVRVSPKGRLPAVPKDVVVLIDASGSIGQDRLGSCRKAARQVLRTATNTGDRFNLVAFRDRFSYAFRSWRPCDAESFAAGDKWLNSLAAHGRTDVFASISSVLTLPRDPTRPLVALVVTDGDANAGVRQTSEILSKFTALNDGLISVYMYGVKGSANRELIDVLTRGNRGESFIFDGWRWNAGDGIEGLSERFRDPLVTDLRLLFAADCQAESYPSLLKNLYRGNTVEVVGRVRGGQQNVRFALRGLAGELAYDGFFTLPLASAAPEKGLAEAFAAERAIDRRLH